MNLSDLAPSRARMLQLCAAGALAGCGRRSGGVAIGTKNFTEELILGEAYAQLLESAGLHVTRRFNLGGTQVAHEALLRGDIDLYPEYTGTALLTVLKLPAGGDAAAIYRTVKQAYAARFQLDWLKPAPMNDTQALATTKAVAARYNVRTLSQLSAVAPQLRLGAIPEFTKREDALPGLQRAYGGFRFKDIKLFDIGLKYKALLAGKVDVVVAFGTDGQIAASDLVIFTDDKHFWPAYQVAPVVRHGALERYPQIAQRLDALAPLLTDTSMRALNYKVDGAKQDPADVAKQFLSANGLT